MLRTPLLHSVLLVVLLTAPAPASADLLVFNPFVGLWTTLATPGEGAAPPFAGLLELHSDGTLTETNGLVHPTGLGAVFPFNGSEGHGTWVAKSLRSVAFTFYKLLFDAAGTHVGYLRVTGTLELDRTNRHRFAGDSNVAIIFGPDPTGPVSENLPNTAVEGTRLRVLAFQP